MIKFFKSSLEILRSNNLTWILSKIYNLNLNNKYFRKVQSFIVNDLDPMNYKDLNIRPCYKIAKGVFHEDLLVNINDFIGWKFYIRGYFEVEPVLLSSALSKSGIEHDFIDVGANIGTTLVGVSKCANNCIAFEPLAQHFNVLEHNIKLNSIQNAQVFNFALGNENKVENLFIKKSNTGASSLLNDWFDENDLDYINRVQIKRFDSMEIDISTFCLIKIDVEGYESFVIDGMKSLIDEDVCILFEYYPDRMNIFHLEDVKNKLLNEFIFFLVQITFIPKKSFTLSLQEVSYQEILNLPKGFAIAAFKNNRREQAQLLNNFKLEL